MIRLSDELRNACPDIALLCLTFEADVVSGSKELWEQIDEIIIPELTAEYETSTLSTHPQIQAARKAYKAAGKDPARYRVSSEMLMRRILQGKGLYRINNFVDCNNLISMQTGLSCGLYDLDQIAGDVTFRIGGTAEDYEAIGRGPFNIEGLPVFSDSRGAFGSPSSDSTRTMITPEAKRALLVMISFSGEAVLNEYGGVAEGYLKTYLAAQNIEHTLVKGGA